MDDSEEAATKQASGDWPNTVRTRDELDAALQAGLECGASKLTGRRIVDRALARLKNG